ncbi:site-2 protease family protein [Lentiprolixibacter aurantiacus]|uniref:Zinc metalloprotease n=1 Tax=Lentiprolixibacter aurantiacus TaxID=2993939 RepID=A0AAE3MNR2_9FLAO|nr:site-2 protease family protein [Lentiprolixibacter aurantiacus]MCX2720763.1 site-2 protease family protein [Lentiprolixibacter aurantiacus]
MKGVLHLGKVAGIKIEVHWTFTLLLIWVVYLDIRRGGDLNSALMNVSLILFLFLCVVLHELGHALTARKFNIGTRKITLLPIGGVASLEKMPEKPRQELLVALAGPAVNVVIALLLLLVVPLGTYLSMEADKLETLLTTPNFSTLLFYLLIANIMLVAFNMIPAFPMDGGRVLRALLAFKMNRARATEIAATLGQTLAVVFFILGLFFNPFLVLIALFIFIGAYGENQMVKQTTLLEGHLVKDAMLTQITTVSPDYTMEQIIDLLLASTEKDFVVVENNQIAGTIYHKEIINRSKDRKLLVRDFMNTGFYAMKEDGRLTEFFEVAARQKQRFFPVIDQAGALVGAIDMTNVSEFLLIKNTLAQ